MYAEALREHAVDAWALWDFRGSNPVLWSVLGIEPPHMTRRAVLVITPERTRLVCSVLDRPHLENAGVELDVYTDRHEFVDKLALSGRVAMEYSPQNALPIVSFVDAGAVELVRSLGAEVVSSAELFQQVAAAWDDEVERSHHEAVTHVMELHALAREHARGSTEAGLVARLVDEIGRRGLETDGEPGVSTGPNSGDPHHEAADVPIGEGVLLVDIWARVSAPARPRTAFADVTWMSCLGDPPPHASEVLAAVAAGRDAALAAAQPGRPAFEADRAARAAIEAAGYGHGLMHRTGHSLGWGGAGSRVHGLGANLDDTETHDDRTLAPGTAFTVEPGVYLPEFGVRLECNVLLRADRAEVTTPLQTELTLLP
jgi:Xaa-Pro aminopeptidase